MDADQEGKKIVAENQAIREAMLDLSSPGDLTAALRSGSTIEDAATHLCRSGTVDDVRRKAVNLLALEPIL